MEKRCLICDKKLSRNARDFCSNECYCEHKRESNLTNIINILESGDNYECTNPRLLKLAVIKIKSHRCDICKNIEWMGDKIPLILDHIDGRAKNNKIDNLRLVCGNCDMKLPTYKSKNKNSDRSHRSKAS